MHLTALNKFQYKFADVIWRSNKIPFEHRVAVVHKIKYGWWLPTKYKEF
jgi:hypothetical protein